MARISKCLCLEFWLLHAVIASSGSGDDVSTSSCVRPANSSKTVIYFSYITGVTGPLLSSQAVPVVDLALELINENTTILSGYHLSYSTIRNSNCTVIGGLDAFNEDFIKKTSNGTNQTYLTLFGCGCSTATIPVAQISHYWNIPHIAFAAAADVLNDRERFRSFFRTIPQYEFLPHALLTLANQFKWSKMSVITQTENLFQTITEEFEALAAKQNNLSLDTSINIPTSSNPLNPDVVENIMNSGAMVTFINAYNNFALGILCNAFRRGLVAPKHIWITHSWYPDNWWKSISVNESCTVNNIEYVLNRSLAIAPSGFFPLENGTGVRYSGLTSKRYKDMYRSRLDGPCYEDYTHFEASGMAFDAVWAIALGLDNVVKNNTNNSDCEDLPGEIVVNLENFTYTNEKMGCVLQKGFEQVNFTGITGDISLANRNRIDNNRLVLHQYRVTDEKGLYKAVVGNFFIDNASSSFKFASNENESTLWPVTKQVHHNHPGLQVIYSILTTAALAFVVVCLVLNIIFLKKNSDLKIVSPSLNFLVIAGAALMYASVYLYVFTADGVLAQTLICNFRQWISSLGYSMCFAVFLAKTWRGYYLFNNANPKIKDNNDWILLVIVIVVVTVDLFIMFIGTAVPDLQLNATLVKDIQHPDFVIAEGRAIQYFVYTCINSGTVIWLAVSYAYKGLLQLVAMFMAFHIRTINIKALNDSKEIAVIIYINSITLVLLALVEFGLNTYHELYAALFGMGLMVGATLFLTLVFIPKLVALSMIFMGKQDPTVAKSSSLVENKLPETETSTILELK